jgi:hypothetical protein
MAMFLIGFLIWLWSNWGLKRSEENLFLVIVWLIGIVLMVSAFLLLFQN